MILDHLRNAAFYRTLTPRMALAFDYLSQADFSSVQPGRVAIEGDDVFAMVHAYDTKVRDAASQWEAHRTYLDIQYVIAGVERMGHASLDMMDVTQPYVPEKDYLFMRERAGQAGQFVDVPAGWFTVFAPQDAHLPGLAADGPAPVTKVVVKVRL